MIARLHNSHYGIRPQCVHAIPWRLLFCAITFISFTFAPATDAANLQEEATSYVSAWLEANPKRLSLSTPRTVKAVKVKTATVKGVKRDAYAVVELDPSGFVILIPGVTMNPIVAFSPKGEFDNNTNSPLYQILQRHASVIAEGTSAEAEDASLLVYEGANATSALGLGMISDVRVAPLVKTKWYQSTAYDENGAVAACYNYFTPPHGVGAVDNYPCGCTATAMAQLMKYHEYPAQPISPSPLFICTVNLVPEGFYLRGGDGSLGPYDWEHMPDDPSAENLPLWERWAIGSLSYDCSVSIGSLFSAGNTGALMSNAGESLRSNFDYQNAIVLQLLIGGISSNDLEKILNPNLDGGFPVLLGIRGGIGPYATVHAVVCDGYGYDEGTLYHHLNMGWSGAEDAWYALPVFSTAQFDFDTVHACVYNVFPETGGIEIVSGRVVDDHGTPIRDASVTLTRTSGGSFLEMTNKTDKSGIYWFGVPPNSFYNLTAYHPWHSFNYSRVVIVGESASQGECGNSWGNDLVGTIQVDAGDYAILGYDYRANSSKMFSCLALVDVPVGASITITDNGWVGTNWRATEGWIVWTNSTVNVLPAGTITTFSRNGYYWSSSIGSVSHSSGMIPNAEGEQVIAFVGQREWPTFLYGLAYHGGGWSTSPEDVNNPSSSMLPSTLQEGITAISLPRPSISARYDMSISSGNKIQLLSAISDPNRWMVDSEGVDLPPPGGVTVTSGYAPPAPTGVSASDGDYTDRVRVSWNSSSGASGYEVWRHISNSSGSASKIGDPLSSPYDDTTAVAGTTYYYWVKAVNAGGTSGFSSSDSGYLALLIIYQPELLAEGQVILTWPSLTGRTYTIRRSGNLLSNWHTRGSNVSGHTFIDTINEERMLFWLVIEEP